MRGTATVVLTAALAAACATTPPPPPPEAEPTLEAARLTVADQTLSSFTATVRATVANPGTAPLAIERVSYTLSLEGEPVREGDEDLDVTVPPGAEATFEVPVAVEHALTSAQLQELQGTESLSVVLDGRIHARRGGAEKTLELDRAARLRPPKLPQVSLGDPDAARQRLDAIAANFRVQILNDNPFEVRIGRLNFALEVEGQPLVEDAVAVGQTVAPSASLVYEVPADLTPQTVPGLVEKLKEKNALDYRLTGTLHVGDLAIPVEEGSAIKFSSERGG